MYLYILSHTHPSHAASFIAPIWYKKTPYLLKDMSIQLTKEKMWISMRAPTKKMGRIFAFTKNRLNTKAKHHHHFVQLKMARLSLSLASSLSNRQKKAPFSVQIMCKLRPFIYPSCFIQFSPSQTQISMKRPNKTCDAKNKIFADIYI